MSAPKRCFSIVRRLDAPRELVFRAWTDPDHLQWFGQTGAPGERQPATVDLRVGGAWRVHMIENEHRSYVTGGVYREIEPPEKIVFTWGAVGGWPPIDPGKPDDGPVVTVTLRDLGGTTEMTFHVGFPDGFTDDSVRHWFSLGVVDGWTRTIDRLAPSLPATVAEPF
ncbi:activator of HSP90 ATPase [Planotetraspora thailandica]|uniref:Activator of HSP90 ATPase n=1 Tax=Planotetraspora thailandica TaxID=487172 RepID=A0A8J3V2G5_9ACTN|nr:SRPBCC domain-containing protein [Planotetraspora thailandica]GII54970.1 activator of HSP90 ATPase [Planotetraspora thailandica]